MLDWRAAVTAAAPSPSDEDPDAEHHRRSDAARTPRGVAWPPARPRSTAACASRGRTLPGSTALGRSACSDRPSGSCRRDGARRPARPIPPRADAPARSRRGRERDRARGGDGDGRVRALRRRARAPCAAVAGCGGAAAERHARLVRRARGRGARARRASRSGSTWSRGGRRSAARPTRRADLADRARRPVALGGAPMGACRGGAEGRRPRPARGPGLPSSCGRRLARVGERADALSDRRPADRGLPRQCRGRPRAALTAAGGGRGGSSGR